VERRLEFIEFRLFWEGRINRGDLIDYFGISAPQASADLALYQDLAGDGLHYDRRAKTYVAAPGFTPRLARSNARLYLANLRLIADDVLTQDELWASWLPPFAALPSLRRRIDTDTLREVLAAIQTGAAIHIEYQSLSRPKPGWRWITPHALVFDGRRWHARAWCHQREDFRDFLFARMLRIDGRRPDVIDPEDDLEWQFQVTARLEPHPDLEEDQRRVVESDYDMENGILEVKMRLCLAFYFVKQFGLDADIEPGSALRHHLVLKNGTEIEALRQTAKQASKSRALERRAHREGEVPTMRAHQDGSSGPRGKSVTHGLIRGRPGASRTS
jgi:hypothetical protein